MRLDDTPNAMQCVLQCVAVCCSVLQCVAVCCSVLQCVAVCCSVLQYDMRLDDTPNAIGCTSLRESLLSESHSSGTVTPLKYLHVTPLSVSSHVYSSVSLLRESHTSERVTLLSGFSRISFLMSLLVSLLVG